MQISQSESVENARQHNAGLRVGDRVRVRHQRWVIADLHAHDDCSVVTLSGIGPANLGLQQQVLAPFDVLDPIISHRGFRVVRARRWRHACRQLIADDGPAGILRTARSAHMDLMPYQLEPALAVVRGQGSRILIADEVGLGKTVQAALIVGELQSRGAASRVLVITPAGLREQWADEFASRFNLQLTLFDMATVARRRASLPIGVNPWSVGPLIVASIDFIKRPEVCPAVQSCRWDVVIVDEAHHVALGTDRRDAVDRLCRSAPYVILLTATPHNGDARAFTALCDIGRHDEQLLVFRRTRQHIGHSHDRRVHQLRIAPNAAERQMHAAVDAFVRAVQREPAGRSAETFLALSTLRKRALSSAFSLERSVQHRLRTLSASDGDDLYQLALPLADAGGEFDADDLPLWAIPALRDSRRERALLTRIEQAASLAAARESKLDALTRILRRVQEPAIVFTEYRDTLLHVRDRIAPDAAVLHGGLSREERRASLKLFQRGGVLLATDAASEGLNLHHACRIVINLELPWSPIRLEQRIGRVDRIGQQRRVHAFHLIAAGTMEVRILERLSTRVASAQADVGGPNPLNSMASELSVDATSLPVEHLDAAAREEHARLTLARRLLAGTQTSDDLAHGGQGHALVTFSKRRAVRSHLGSRILVVFQSVLWNEAGQAAASHLTPVLLRIQRDTRLCLKDLETLDAIRTSDAGYNAWLATSLSTHQAFWNTRLRRESAITKFVEHMSVVQLQPGLFDLRAERAWLDEDNRRREVICDRTSRTKAALRATSVTANGSHVALVLCP